MNAIGSTDEIGAIGAKPTLIFYGSDSALLEKLKHSSVGLHYVDYQAGFGPQVTEKAQLDALWATLMGGIELFGAQPPFPLHEARVVQTPPSQVEKGLPRYGIVGVAISESDPKSPDYNLRLVISALLRAVIDFNSHGLDQIRRVGILPADVELAKIKPEAAFKIVRELYEAA